MNTALIYRARSRWLILVALVCAVGIHLAAIAIAGNRSKPVIVSAGSPNGGVIVIIDNQPPSQPDEEVSPPQILPDNDAFPDENFAPRAIRPRKKTPIAPVVRSIGFGRPTQSGSAKALALYAPRPGYPYEARRGNVTGSGVADLLVNSESGIVIDAQMSQSTGSAILDKATVEAFRRWRFKTGVASNIAVPITYTLTGVSY